ncbi:hypothetical protein HID58_002963 [Brassica napus]|uniref:Uncharacterized protein n=1 Tax=Brassica napus TaxID=3708 RepID=A0ABQ8ERV9_BRANA|nr:hypothetical protein HID58_002958 [Brassica napus]KAH0943326.1 hypothetical protein HID58_002963 [Brassica napus]
MASRNRYLEVGGLTCFTSIYEGLISWSGLRSLFVQAAWTQRSRGKAAKRGPTGSHRSKEQTCMYMRPFLLNEVHPRQIISVATTNARDISGETYEACRLIRKLIAECSMEADVYAAVSCEPRKGERIEGLGIVIDTIKEHDIDFTFFWRYNRGISRVLTKLRIGSNVRDEIVFKKLL